MKFQTEWTLWNLTGYITAIIGLLYFTYGMFVPNAWSWADMTSGIIWTNPGLILPIWVVIIFFVIGFIFLEGGKFKAVFVLYQILFWFYLIFVYVFFHLMMLDWGPGPGINNRLFGAGIILISSICWKKHKDSIEMKKLVRDTLKKE